jgi:hypothetical protein
MTPEVVNLVQSVPKSSLSTKLIKRTPMQVFIGHAETIPLALRLKDNILVNAPLDLIKAQKLIEVESFSKAVTEIHAQEAEKSTSDCKAAIQKHNIKTHVRSPNFRVDDFMLVTGQRKSSKSKISSGFDPVTSHKRSVVAPPLS